MRSLSIVNPPIAVPTIDELVWRESAIESYIANINDRIDKVVNGYYRDITLNDGRVVKRHYKSSGTVETWTPYLEEAKRMLDTVRTLSPTEIVDVDRLTLARVSAIVCGLSNPSKMPCLGYNLPAERCVVGSKLRSGPLQVTPCHFCYARKGRYVFPNVMRAMYLRLESLFNPNWTRAMVRLIEAKSKPCTSAKCASYGIGHYHYRWHDSGDIQNIQHMRNICEVARLTPRCIHWIPTQEWDVLRVYDRTYGPVPSNLIVRRSSTRLDKPIHPWGILPHVVASYVNTGKMQDEESTYYCPSRHQEGMCGDCRACWTPTVQQVAYHVH